MKWYIVLSAVFGAFAIVGAVQTVYQIYKMAVMDATARGLKHPKLWGILAANGNNSCLLLYLIARRDYPIISMSGDQMALMEKRKKSVGVGLVFITVGVIGIIVSLTLLRP